MPAKRNARRRKKKVDPWEVFRYDRNYLRAGFIRELRRGLELTQTQLAERYSISRRTVIRWEARGVQALPWADYAQQLAEDMTKLKIGDRTQ